MTPWFSAVLEENALLKTRGTTASYMQMNALMTSTPIGASTTANARLRSRTVLLLESVHLDTHSAVIGLACPGSITMMTVELDTI
jgi:hypothetical protein